MIEKYIKLTRPFTLIMPAVGIYSGAAIALRGFPGHRVFIVALAASMLNAASNVFNQYCDVEIDRINKPARVLVKNEVKRISAVIFSLLLYLVSVFSVFFVSRIVFL